MYLQITKKNEICNISTNKMSFYNVSFNLHLLGDRDRNVNSNLLEIMRAGKFITVLLFFLSTLVPRLP